MDATKLADTLAHLVQLLVSGQFEELERLSGGRELSADELRTAVAEYPHRLVMPPGSSPDWLREGDEVMEIEGTMPPSYHVDVDLWDETGRSDLTLSVVLTESPEPLYRTRIVNLHVL